jgi:hypothetical protein
VKLQTWAVVIFAVVCWAIMAVMIAAVIWLRHTAPEPLAALAGIDPVEHRGLTAPGDGLLSP